jgi:hypothetical protein
MAKVSSAVIVLIFAATLVNAENSVVLSQKASPLKIIKYEATYQEESRGAYSSHPDQIRHTVSCENVSGNTIVAFQIGLVAFDAFNDFMDKFDGWSIKTVSSGGNAESIWTQSPYAAFSFRKYGTGVAYISAVRFEDGTIWRANLTEILLELQKFEKNLKKEDLEEKKKP